MRGNKTSIALATVLTVLTISHLLEGTCAAAQESVQFSFGNTSTDGVNPVSNLIFDAPGNLYGVAGAGGANGYGTVFELMPQSGGGWTEKVLYNFGTGSFDGKVPTGTLIFDGAGNLYGTTAFGGLNNAGTVFQLVPRPGGTWGERVLYSFKLGPQGESPYSGLIMDSHGNLYGTAQAAGRNDHGAVFELIPTPRGPWTEDVLYNFHKYDGADPRGGLIFDSAGNLYGTTNDGGTYNLGTVFELTNHSGEWTETVLHDFNLNGTDGTNPMANLIFDSAGNLYGATAGGGPTGAGAIFKLSPSSGGTWTETILYSFNYNGGADGFNPQSSLYFDSAGNLYGTTVDGGSGQCTQIGIVIGCGIVFKLEPGSGTWTEVILHNFADDGIDGQQSTAGLIPDSAGNLYGTTNLGGTYGGGTVFKVTP
jgi:uncharacterized repeat protein (TIGR03803 family)